MLVVTAPCLLCGSNQGVWLGHWLHPLQAVEGGGPRNLGSDRRGWLVVVSMGPLGGGWGGRGREGGGVERFGVIDGGTRGWHTHCKRRLANRWGVWLGMTMVRVMGARRWGQRGVGLGRGGLRQSVRFVLGRGDRLVHDLALAGHTRAGTGFLALSVGDGTTGLLWCGLVLGMRVCLRLVAARRVRVRARVGEGWGRGGVAIGAR